MGAEDIERNGGYVGPHEVKRRIESWRLPCDMFFGGLWYVAVATVAMFQL